jgi:translation initiation factor 1 (eIF-1/SUI1)
MTLLASKEFKQKFACGASVTKDEIVIQGDLKDDVYDFILANYPV